SKDFWRVVSSSQTGGASASTIALSGLWFTGPRTFMGVSSSIPYPYFLLTIARRQQRQKLHCRAAWRIAVFYVSPPDMRERGAWVSAVGSACAGLSCERTSGCASSRAPWMPLYPGADRGVGWSAACLFRCGSTHQWRLSPLGL